MIGKEYNEIHKRIGKAIYDDIWISNTDLVIRL